MPNNNNQKIGLGEAASRFLVKLSAEEAAASQPEIYRFVRWYGWDRPLSNLTAPEVSNYAEQLSLSDTDYARKLEQIRAFLVHAKKEGWSQTNLSVHLKSKKSKASLSAQVKQGLPEIVTLTRQGFAELEAELAKLKVKRQEIIDEMRRAAADKDFRENAPLDAAREQRGLIEGRIKKLEKTLKLATVINNEPKRTLKINISDTVVLRDPASGEEMTCIIVHSREADPAQGKISNASPIGKALIGRSEGESVEVTVPAGKLRYQIKRIVR